MDKIATVGQNEVQDWIRWSFENIAGFGTLDVNQFVMVQKDVTNDKGIEGIDKVDGGGASTKGAEGRNQIGLPSISFDMMSNLLDDVAQVFDVDREIEFLGVENDEKTFETSLKQNKFIRVTFGKKHADQVKTIRDNAHQMPDGTDPSKVIGLVFKGIGVAMAFLHAALVTAATGGAAVGLFIAAGMALAAFIADVSGGFEEMQKAISKSLQENNGMSKEDADAAAGYISMGIQLAFEIATTVVGGCTSNPQQKLASFITKAKNKFPPSVADKKIFAMGEKTAIKLFGKTAKGDVNLIKKVIAQAEAINKFERTMNLWKSLLPITEALANVICQKVSYDESVKRGESEADIVLSESDTEALQEQLSQVGQDTEQYFKRRAHRLEQLAAILLSSIESSAQINNELGDMA